MMVSPIPGACWENKGSAAWERYHQQVLVQEASHLGMGIYLWSFIIAGTPNPRVLQEELRQRDCSVSSRLVTTLYSWTRTIKTLYWTQQYEHGISNFTKHCLLPPPHLSFMYSSSHQCTPISPAILSPIYSPIPTYYNQSEEFWPETLPGHVLQNCHPTPWVLPAQDSIIGSSMYFQGQYMLDIQWRWSWKINK